MSNKKVTDSDEATSTADKPMEDPQVDVRVKPVRHKVRGRMPRGKKEEIQKQNEENRHLAEKVKKSLKQQIEKKVDEAGAKPGGTRKAQYDAAEKAVSDAAEQVSRRKINQIDVIVEDDRDDHYISVTPKEGAPPNDEDD